MLSRVPLSVTPWTVATQSPVSRGFSRQEYWSGLPLPSPRETWVPSLSREDPLEKGMATHCNILVWRIQLTKEPGGLQSLGLQRVGHDGATNTDFVQQIPIQHCKVVILQLSKKALANSQGFTTQHHYLLRVPKSTQVVSVV